MTPPEPSERPTAAEVAGILARMRTGVDAAAVTMHLFTRPPTRPLPVPDWSAVDVSAIDVDGNTRRTLLDHPAPSVGRTSRSTRQAMIAAAIVVVLAGLLVAVLTLNPARPTTTSDLPAGLPPQLTEDLRELHEAVNG